MLGIYGFATLFLQYLAYLGLGIQYAINVELATSSGANDRNIIASATALTALIGSGIVIAGTVVQFREPKTSVSLRGAKRRSNL